MARFSRLADSRQLAGAEENSNGAHQRDAVRGCREVAVTGVAEPGGPPGDAHDAGHALDPRARRPVVSLRTHRGAP